MPFNENEKRYNKLDKLAEGEKLQTVYSTEKVEKIIKDMGKGLQVDMSPFFHGDTRYKDAGLLYNYTEHELEELQKCADDCLYYVKNYCKFLNDKGRTLVQLRDYQEQYIQMLGEQEYDEEIGESIPKNRRIITMMARQSSKCLVPTCTMHSIDKDVSFLELDDDKSWAFKIKKFLYKIYSHEIIKNIIGFLIQLIEKIENHNAIVLEGKFLSSKVISIEIESENKTVHASKIHKTIPYQVYEI